MFYSIVSVLFLAGWSVLSAGQERPSIRLDDFTVPPDKLPTGCQLSGAPWIGTDRAGVARIAGRIEGPSRAFALLDGPPPSRSELRQLESSLGYADGVEAAYSASYSFRGAPPVNVLAIKLTDPTSAYYAFGRINRSLWQGVWAGSIVAVVDSDYWYGFGLPRIIAPGAPANSPSVESKPDTACLWIVAGHVRSVTSR